MNSLKRFACDEDGAVTVDFLVLTAGVVVLAVAVAPPIRDRVFALGAEIAQLIDAFRPFPPD